jgi:hypothetical protein
MGKSKSKNLFKNKIVWLILLAFFFIISSIQLLDKKIIVPKEVKINVKNYNYYLETAATPNERKIGLSNRQNLCTNCGMLFIFNKQGTYSFWMKDTFIPLDIIWLDKNFKIVKISTVLETNSEKRYTNKVKAKYVIELNANEVFKRDLNVGDTIQLPDFK